MAAALECWSSRTAADEEIVEQVLMSAGQRSEGPSAAANPTESSSAMQKKLRKLSRNVSEAISSLRNSLNLDSPTGGVINARRNQAWSGVARGLTQLFPGGQLPDKLVSNIRKHYDSMPLSYAQAGFSMRDVLVHIRLMEQASMEDQPAILVEKLSNDLEHGLIYKAVFVCNCLISWPLMSRALESSSVCCKKVQIFERRGSTLGDFFISAQADQENKFKAQIEDALRGALKKPKQGGMKLAFRLCGCQDENVGYRDLGETEEDAGERNYRNRSDHSNLKVRIPVPLPSSSILASVDEWQTIRSEGDEISKWMLSSDSLEFLDQIAPNSFKGVYMGKKVSIEKLKGCDKGNSYELELRRDLLELMTCGHRNLVRFLGICIDEIHGLCVVTRLMEGGSVHDLMIKRKKLQMKEVMNIAVDVAESLKFLNDHGVAFRDLNTQRILLDRHGNACLSDLGVVTACKSICETLDYETDGYRWLAPEIIAGDPESVTETWMSNVYSFGMVVWEMVTGEAAYGALSPVQAAVGIAACGLRPEIPKDCPQVLKSLMIKCWDNCPAKRLQFGEVLSALLQCDTVANAR